MNILITIFNVQPIFRAIMQSLQMPNHIGSKLTFLNVQMLQTIFWK